MIEQKIESYNIVENKYIYLILIYQFKFSNFGLTVVFQDYSDSFYNSTNYKARNFNQPILTLK